MKFSLSFLAAFILSFILGFSLYGVYTYRNSALLQSLFLPENHTYTSPPTSPDTPTLLYGVNVDMSQILPGSEKYIVNDQGIDLIDIAASLGIRVLRITNNTRSFSNHVDAIYTPDQWNQVLDKMQEKNMQALIVIETVSDNPKYFTQQISPEYLQLVQHYIIDSQILSHPNIYGIDLKNEPMISDQNVAMITAAAQKIKHASPATRLTVGWWSVGTGEKDDDGNELLNWKNFAAGKQLDAIVDFYSLHIYGFDERTLGMYPDPYTYTKKFITNVKTALQTDKPLLIEEFGAANGQAVTDSQTLGSPQLQANTYAGVYQAIIDLHDPTIAGTIAYQFHSQTKNPDGWAILTHKANDRLPAANVLQQFATGQAETAIVLPMNPVPKDILFDNGDNDKTTEINPGDIAGLNLVFNPAYQYLAETSDGTAVALSQPLTYVKKQKKYHAVFHALQPGKARIVVRRVPRCDGESDCPALGEEVFSLRLIVN